MHPTRLRLLGASFGLSLIAGVLSACNILGPAMIIAEGPPKTKAQYTLPKERVTVVFIDDRRSYLPRRNLRDAIAGEASQRLLDNKAVMTVVNPRDAAAGVAGERNNAPIDLVTLTTNSKAEIMVYATIDDFQLFPDRETFQPTAVVRVKVIDAKAAEPRIWPEEREGKKLVIQMPISSGAGPKSAAEKVNAETMLAQEVGRSIAEVFYEHETKRKMVER